ncbi:MAG: DUF3800 domain-containing protein [Candidatus Peribacteria bacterium]|nr:DUF3800 domain-containing protein [Candidatus Peribacteria bacterium]
MYIFMDESGDLGFDSNKNNSKYFIISFLCIPDTITLKNLLGKYISEAKKKKARILGGVLHASKEKPSTIVPLLQLLSQRKDISAMTIYIKKSKIPIKLHNDKHLFYNNIVNILWKQIIKENLLPTNEKIIFTASRRETKKSLNTTFIELLKATAKQNNINVEVAIKTPFEMKGLQLVDFICWAFYQKYEMNQYQYYDIIQPLVVKEEELKSRDFFSKNEKPYVHFNGATP